MNKKLFISRIIKLSAFCLIFIFLFSYSYKVLSWKDGSGGYNSAAVTLYNKLDDDIVDVLFLGSSHCFCSISNTQLYDEHGIGAFNMVISGQDLASTYYSMREVFKTQSPEVVCVELYGITFEKHAVTANIYRNALSFRYSENFFGVVDAIAPEEDKTDYLLKWPIIHTRYRELQKEDFVSVGPAYLGGSADATRVAEIYEFNIYNGDKTAPISEKNEQWIQKMVDFAKENDTEICFFVVPYVADEKEQQQFRYVEQMLAKQNVSVINFFDKIEEIGFDYRTDFSDKGHTNNSGAAKITSYMGNYIKENHNIPDRRGDDRYTLWQENSLALKHRKDNQQLVKINDINDYFSYLSTLEDKVIVVASNGEHNYPDTDITSSLSKLGISSEFVDNGGVWVIDNGNVVFSSSEQNFSFYHDVTEGVIAVKGNENGKKLTLNRNTYSRVDNGINIIVYDNYLGEMVEYMGFDASNAYNEIR